ncbi:MAG: PQQ-dependent sugar dehydrogenase [Nitrospinae bacterium]|nr:PQQ-dependent sugar dehydrogenase [Nitrospinota bacterium]
MRLTAVEKMTGNVDFPVSLCQFDKDTILFTEKSGSVRVIKNGILLKKPMKTLDVATGFEKGLLGIACKDGAVYVYHTYSTGLSTYNRVVRLNPEKVILDKIPGAVFHNGGALVFGPDGMLYISTGDARDEKSAQDIKSLAGKIIRIAPDGSIPADNPFKGSPVWSLGHRNVFGMTFNDKGELFITENGTSRDDEINVIQKGRNYGWPVVLGVAGDRRYENPLKTYTPNIAPTNGAFYKDWFIFGAWNTGEIRALKIKGKVALAEKTLYMAGSGVTDVKYFTDGYLHFVSRDGIYRAVLDEGPP